MGIVHAKDIAVPNNEDVDEKVKRINLSKVSARIERIHIEGLKRTKDDIVIESVQELFSSTDFHEVIANANRVRDRLAELGCFKQVDIFIDTASGEGASKDGLEVTFSVKELKRLKGSVKTLVGNNEGSLVVGGSAPNLFGRGERFHLESSWGYRSFNNIDIGFTKPLRSKYNAVWTSSVFQQRGDFPWSAYKLTDRGILLDLAFNSFPLIRHNVQYEASWKEFEQLSKSDPFPARKEYGHSLKSSLRHILTLDRRDSAIFPTRGGMLRITSELAGLGGNIGFLKNEALMQANFSLPAGIVLQGTAQAGLLQPMFNQRTTPADRFYLGGPTSVRGFLTRGIGPRQENVAVGGNLYWATGVHLYSPLPFKPGRTVIGELFRLHLFTTLGQCENINFEESNFNAILQNYRASYGGGLVLRIADTAQIELNYVIPFLSRQTDAPNPGVQLGLGIQFL